MVVSEFNVNNIMGGMESTGGVRLHNHRRKLKQRFDIIRKLGQGTYGKVQLGINKETGQEVAIKTIKKAKIETEADLIRIRREIQIMSSVQHPNIIHIYEVFENREKMVLVMEYAAGGELYDFLSERRVLPEKEARRIFRQIATAVFYCHKHKICHRDLKLENILLDENGSAKIADFGLSNVFDEQRLLSTFCGSPLYASPEIVKGTPYHGPEVDCWSLGVLLYTLVYGAMPFDGSNFKRLVKQISNGDYFEPKKPSPASPLVAAMLTVNPAQRADIETICSHWWVNEGESESCLELAQQLASQTPVRLDLLLSLAPPPTATVTPVGSAAPVDGQVDGAIVEAGPVKSRSEGCLNEVNTRIIAPHSDSVKRKIETTDSESNEIGQGAKRKDRSRRRDRERSVDRRRSGSRSKPPTSRDRKMKKEPSMEEAQLPAKSLTTTMVPADKEVVKTPSNVPKPSQIRGDLATNMTWTDISESQPTQNEIEPPSGEATSKPLNMTWTEIPSPSSEALKESEVPIQDKEKPPEDAPKQVEVEDSEKLETEKKKENGVSTVKRKTIKVKKTKSASIDGQADNKVRKKRSESQERKTLEESETPDKKSEVISKPKTDIPENSIESIEKENKEEIKIENEDSKTKDVDKKESPIKRRISVKKKEEKEKEEDKKVVRRKSRVFETVEQLLSGGPKPSASETRPKQVFIPGVKVSDAKSAFERRSSVGTVLTKKPSEEETEVKDKEEKSIKKIKESSPKKDLTPKKEPSPKKEVSPKKEEENIKVKNEIIDQEKEKKEKIIEKKPKKEVPRICKKSKDKNDEGKENIKVDTSPTPVENETKIVNITPETTRSAEPEENLNLNQPDDSKILKEKAGLKVKAVLKEKMLEEQRSAAVSTPAQPGTPISDEGKPPKPVKQVKVEGAQQPTTSTQVHITLRSQTLPRPRKTSRANIQLTSPPPTPPQSAPEYKSEVTFPVNTDTRQTRSVSLEPQKHVERIIPIRVEREDAPSQVVRPNLSRRSSSVSRQSTLESDDGSIQAPTPSQPTPSPQPRAPEPLRRVKREHFIPIAIEGGGYITPKNTSQDGSVLSESDDDSFSGFHHAFHRPLSRDSETGDDRPFGLHRLRSSRPTRPEHQESQSSGEEEDDDGFEMFSAESLFSTLLSRVRSLTHRLQVDDLRPHAGFWSTQPLSRRINDNARHFPHLSPSLWPREPHDPRRGSSANDMFTPSLAARRAQQHQKISRQNSQPKDFIPEGRNFQNNNNNINNIANNNSNNNTNNTTTRSAPSSEYGVPYRTSYLGSESGRPYSASSQSQEHNNSFRNVNYQEPRSPTTSEYSYRTLTGSRNSMYDPSSSRGSSLYESQVPMRSTIFDSPRASIYDSPSSRSSLYEQMLPRGSLFDQNNRSSLYEHNSARNAFYEQNAGSNKSPSGSEYSYSTSRYPGQTGRSGAFEARSTSLDGSGCDFGYSRSYIDSTLSDYDSLRRPRRNFGVMERPRPVLGRANSVFRAQSSRPIAEVNEPVTLNGEASNQRRKSLQEPASPLPPRRLLMEIRRHDTAPVGPIDQPTSEISTGEEAEQNISEQDGENIEDRSGQTPLAERIRNLQGAVAGGDEMSESALLQRAISLDESEDSPLAERIRARSFFSRFNTRRRRAEATAAQREAYRLD